MPAMPKAYLRLKDRFERMATLSEASAMLGWDASAMMPAGGGAARADQLAVLASLAHGMIIDQAVADDLTEAEQEVHRLDVWEATNLRLMRHHYTLSLIHI
mgnify:CR=1 FL=1